MTDEQQIIFNYSTEPIGDIDVTPEGWSYARGDIHHGNWIREHRDIDHDPHFTRWCADWITPQKAVVDIGANIGTHSIPYLRRRPSWLISVEPSPTLFECLRRNLLKEIVQSVRETSVMAFCRGAGEHCNKVPYHYDSEMPGASYIGYVGRGRADMIEVAPLHHFTVSLPEEEIIGFLKIDVEGYEPFVIQGASRNILDPIYGKARPTIVMEVNSSCLARHGWNQTMLLELMASIDYKELGTWPPEYDALPREKLISMPVFEKCFIPG